MHFFINANYPFMKWRRIGYAFSIITLLLSIAVLLAKGGPKWSVDFVGGTLVQIATDRDVSIADIREAMSAIDLGTAEIQRFGESNEYLIRVDRALYGEQTGDKIVEALQGHLSGATIDVRRTEDVGPKVGKELRANAAWAVTLGLLAILVYIKVRYEFRFAASGVVALFHDILFVVGFLTLIGKEFSLGVMAALLTIAGYSINDTIIIYDRIREGMRTMRRESFGTVVDVSINRTLSRTVITSGLTLSCVVALYLFGGEVIRDFALALLVGIVIGTYSSIFVAGAIVLDWRAYDQTRAEKKRLAAA
jgi:preprotein translocase SecF subunit